MLVDEIDYLSTFGVFDPSYELTIEQSGKDLFTSVKHCYEMTKQHFNGLKLDSPDWLWMARLVFS